MASLSPDQAAQLLAESIAAQTGSFVDLYKEIDQACAEAWADLENDRRTNEMTMAQFVEKLEAAIAAEIKAEEERFADRDP